MKTSRELKSMIAVILSMAAVMVALVGIGCAGGGGDTGSTTLSVVPLPGGTGTLPSTGTTAAAAGTSNQLSTFNSKDPFIAQAKPVTTTTKLTTTTLPKATTTTRSTTTTTRSTTTTTTAPHRLMVTAFYAGPTITFTLDGITFSHLTVGAVLTGLWGSVEIMAIQLADALNPTNIVTFKRGISIDFTAVLNVPVQW
jgi:hypothetical protein